MAATVIEILFLLVAHSIAGIYSSTLKYKRSVTYIIWGAWVAVQGTLFVVSELNFTDQPLQFLIGFVTPLVCQYVIFFLTTKGRFAERLFIISTYSIFFCIAMGLFTMVKGSFTSIPPVVITLIDVLILSGVVFYFLRCVCALCRRAAKNIESGWAPLIFVNLVFILTVVLSSVFPEKLGSFYDPGFVTFVFISVSIMAVYPVIFSNINSMSEASMKREVEAQNAMLLSQIEAENALLAADSQSRHDRRHHNLVLLELARNDDVEGVKEYLQNLVNGEAEVWGSGRYCDNTTVNTVITVYERRARQNGICVNVSAFVTNELELLPKDAVIVIANLFENAINATEKLKGGEKIINISIKEDTQRLLCRIDNPCKEKNAFDESRYGIGIRSVIAIVEKYNGMYDFTVEDGMFSAKISLNLR